MNWKVVDIKSEFATFQCTSGLKICNLDNENIGVNLKKYAFIHCSSCF